MASFRGTKLWDPRLRAYSDDAAIFKRSPMKEAFEKRSSGTQTRRKAGEVWIELYPTLNAANWIQHIDDWVAYCLGGELHNNPPRQAQQLFLDVLWIRYSHAERQEGDREALSLLRKVQLREGFYAFGELPVELCWLDDIAPRESYHGDPDAGDRLSDFEEEDDQMDTDDMDDNDPMDPDYVDIDEIDHTPTFIQSAQPPRLAAIPTKLKPRSPRLEEYHIDPDDCPYRWATNVRNFFYPPEQNSSDCRNYWDVVLDLVEMRELGSRNFGSKSFRKGLKDSGLYNLLHDICKPGNLLETSHPDVERSFRWYDWKIAYAEMICRWAEAIISQEEYESSLPLPDLKFRFTPAEARELLLFISSNPRMHPWGYDPMAIFMFLSQACFEINCEIWLLPSLTTLNYSVSTRFFFVTIINSGF
ncbi:hypothetical protein B0H15DRAFT_953979 [Mycena belliarum]|uniref:Uncharacterized protein n=1 Tax=Mycena belliarum TaxID=1033014 RepID=A0AAD6TW95_9AGAR|nr:hypothetical protein B0H15DRAFT_953979 [Mycena belliae]